MCGACRSSYHRHNYSITYTSKQLIVCTSDLHHSTQRPEHYEIKSYHFWVNFPFNIPSNYCAVGAYSRYVPVGLECVV